MTTISCNLAQTVSILEICRHCMRFLWIVEMSLSDICPLAEVEDGTVVAKSPPKLVKKE